MCGRQSIPSRIWSHAGRAPRRITFSWTFFDCGLALRRFPITGATGTYSVPVVSLLIIRLVFFWTLQQRPNRFLARRWWKTCQGNGLFPQRRLGYRFGLLDLTLAFSSTSMGGPAMATPANSRSGNKRPSRASLTGPSLQPGNTTRTSPSHTGGVNRWALKPRLVIRALGKLGPRWLLEGMVLYNEHRRVFSDPIPGRRPKSNSPSMATLYDFNKLARLVRWIEISGRRTTHLERQSSTVKEASRDRRGALSRDSLLSFEKATSPSSQCQRQQRRSLCALRRRQTIKGRCRLAVALGGWPTFPEGSNRAAHRKAYWNCCR